MKTNSVKNNESKNVVANKSVAVEANAEPLRRTDSRKLEMSHPVVQREIAYIVAKIMNADSKGKKFVGHYSPLQSATKQFIREMGVCSDGTGNHGTRFYVPEHNTKTYKTVKAYANEHLRSENTMEFAEVAYIVEKIRSLAKEKESKCVSHYSSLLVGSLAAIKNMGIDYQPLERASNKFFCPNSNTKAYKAMMAFNDESEIDIIDHEAVAEREAKAKAKAKAKAEKDKEKADAKAAKDAAKAKAKAEKDAAKAKAKAEKDALKKAEDDKKATEKAAKAKAKAEAKAAKELEKVREKAAKANAKVAVVAPTVEKPKVGKKTAKVAKVEAKAKTSKKTAKVAKA